MIGEKRSYAVSKSYMLNAIWDMAELQNGKKVTDADRNGCIGYSIHMYDKDYTYLFTVEEVDSGCDVLIEMDDISNATMIYRTFFLLESLLAQKRGEQECEQQKTQ